MHDWSEVRRLHQVERLSKSAIAAKLSMSRTTVDRLLSLDAPPKYERTVRRSQLDEFADAIAAMLDADPRVPATVVIQQLRPLGYQGGISILKDHLAVVRPQFLRARTYQRTSYVPGEIGQTDWWSTGVMLPVGKGQSREAFGLVTGLPFSAAFRVVFAFNKTTAAFCPSLNGGLARLGGLPSVMVSDNDACIVASRRGGRVTLVGEVAALYGQLSLKAVALRPAFPEGKGFIERTIRFMETSFMPLRDFTDLHDMQAQFDDWSVRVADLRRVRRIDAVVADALAVERAALRELPQVWPDTDQHREVRATSDCFVRVADVDYSIPPKFARRRLNVRASLDHVRVFCDGQQIAAHTRSWVRADVVTDPAHAASLRLARQADLALRAGDPGVAVASLDAYDSLVG